MHSSIAARLLACICLSSTLAACGGSGPSDVGSQQSIAPTAIITVIGHPFRTASGSTTATVRAQSEVTLSAKDSINGSSPILDFAFEQTGSNERVPLLSRARNSVSFATPAVLADTTLTFRLRVTDAEGRSDESDISLLVKAVRDPNRFLTYSPAPGTYTLVAVPAQTIAADPAASLDASAGEFTLTVRRLLTYRDRSGTMRTEVPLDVAPNPAPLQIRGAWLARTGASASCLDAPENPRFVLEIPSLDQDDLNVLTQSGDRNQQLELADIDEAVLQLQVTIDRDAGSVEPQVCVLNPNDAAAMPLVQGAASARVSIAALKGSATDALDTLASSRAYYRALGEENTKTSFFEWLDANGFDRRAPNFGADAHAVYTNNFDLGFGRDMYLKVGDCDTPTLDFGTCDVSSVVVNYSTLEAAAKKLAPIVAVAMEYRATPTSGGRRLVKFYAYAPDPHSPVGDYKRVHSVNLDGRGEKYLPEACTVCHGGSPGGLTAGGEYANGGDVNAAFLPWDLDTLLFSDTDPSFTSHPTDAALRLALTRTQQESELRKLNAGAYLTYGDANRFAVMRELVAGWYTAAPMPVAQLDAALSGTHSGDFVPAGWSPHGLDGVAGTADDNPSDAATIYTQVFGPHCRSCHTAQVPNPAIGDVRQMQLCDADRPLSEATPGAGRQRPIGCYWQLASDPQLPKRLSEGTMPMSRLTMDRFWVTSDGSSSQGENFAAHLQAVLGNSGAVSPPGAAVARVALQFADASGVPEADTSADIGHYVQLSTQDAAFVREYAWSVARCADPQDVSTCAPVATSNATGAIASSRIEQAGEYRVELRVNGMAEPLATQVFSVADRTPQLAASANKDFSVGASTPISDLLTALGNGSVQDHLISIAVASGQLIVEPAACLAPSSCAATSSIVLSSASVAPLNSSFTVSVRDLNDAAAVQASYPVSVTSTITAGDRTICTRANSSGANLTSDLLNCAAGVGFASSVDLLLLNSAAFGARTDLGIEFPSGALTSLRNLDNNRGTLSIAGSGNPLRPRLVSYVPPLRLSTHTRTGAAGALNAGQPTFDTVPYRIVRFDGGGSVVEQSNTATLRIQINARTSFAGDVMPVFAAQGCSLGGCHDGSQPDRPNYAQSAAQVFALFRGPDGSLRDMINQVGGLPRAYVRPFENPATLTNSGLLCWPMNVCSGGLHSGGTFDADQLQAIRQWIEDGANSF